MWVLLVLLCCLYFLKEMSKEIPFEAFLNTLAAKNQLQNEIFFSNYFKKL